jgi:hypothetical protein
MSVKAIHDARSRFIKAYLLTWGLLAAGGLGYLITLTWQGDVLAPTPPRQQVAEPDAGMRTASRALAEVGSVRRTVGELQKDLGELKETVEKHATEERTVHSRLTALEERVTSISTQAAAPPEPTVKQKAAEKAHKVPTDKAQKVGAEKAQKGGEPRAPTRVISAVEQPKTAAPGASKTDGTAAPIETGSIRRQPPIHFGEPVVMPTREIYAVQLASAPSLESLRLSWSLLLERHGADLAALQPRYVAPRAAGGTYRLVAGPLASAAEAERICVELQAQRSSCLSTQFVGDPL